MPDDDYVRLAEALDRLPNGFPRTGSGLEIRILQKIFTPGQAALACHLTGTFEPVEAIALRAEQPAAEASRLLFKMVRAGMVWLDRQDRQACFRLAPFVVGVYEAQAELMDHELAHLVEDYFAEGGTQGIMGLQPALQRVVPATGTVKAEAILPYEDVRAILLSARKFNVIDCICRLQQDQLGSPCKYPVHVCLNFSQAERAPRPGDISQAEALSLLEQSEQVGLVHTVSNVMEGMGYICNCCGCCCGILRGITKFGIENSVAYSNYYAVIDPQFCAACGNCIERCQVGAISAGEGFSVVERSRCIGCGLCVSGCPNGVARLERKPEAEAVLPPTDFAAWEHARLVNRGLAEAG
ncbi:MAG TPA: 4Fe-4S binding protein [Anaerolineales bacterium]|nr:4Fe-4S binding protein [Anaerolineales bacterium]